VLVVAQVVQEQWQILQAMLWPRVLVVLLEVLVRLLPEQCLLWS
jgi:hypothetical protein